MTNLQWTLWNDGLAQWSAIDNWLWVAMTLRKWLPVMIHPKLLELLAMASYDLWRLWLVVYDWLWSPGYDFLRGVFYLTMCEYYGSKAMVGAPCDGAVGTLCSMYINEVSILNFKPYTQHRTLFLQHAFFYKCLDRAKKWYYDSFQNVDKDIAIVEQNILELMESYTDHGISDNALSVLYTL